MTTASNTILPRTVASNLCLGSAPDSWACGSRKTSTKSLHPVPRRARPRRLPLARS